MATTYTDDHKPMPWARVMHVDDDPADDHNTAVVLPPEKAHEAEDRCAADEEYMVPVRWSTGHARWEYAEDLRDVPESN